METQEIELMKKELRVLEALAARAQTSFAVHRNEDADSIEIGGPTTGRVKVYGDFRKKAEFSAKIKDALEVLAGAQEALGAQGGGKPEK